MNARFAAKDAAPVEAHQPSAPVWKPDGTPGNEDALQITAWVMHHLEAGRYARAKWEWGRRGRNSFPSAYPGISTGVAYINVSPAKAMREWVRVRAATLSDPARGIAGWRELLSPNVRLSEAVLYRVATPEVRAQYEAHLTATIDGPEAREPRMAKRYITDLRDGLRRWEQAREKGRAFAQIPQHMKQREIDMTLAALRSASPRAGWR